MKISYSWLKSYINTDISAEEMSKTLTDTGLEVEKVHITESVPGGLKGLVIGKVLSKEKHADADRLNVTTVDLGGEAPLQIVCGAPNVEAGQKVVVATNGTIIHPSEGEPFKIKKSKIRGVESNGMICAEDEIGLGKGHDGIMVLDETAAVGTLASEFFNVEDDIQFEIGLTPNRADGMSHIGVARDLLCALKHQGKIEEASVLNWPSVDSFSPLSTCKVQVEVKDEDACPRYAGLTVTGLKVNQSPEWLQKRLISIGLKPINNVVDATNFVLHELGQPLHAFDLQKVKGNKIIVQQLPAKSKFTTLDEVSRELDANDLMICNEADGMCIAGVFGGIDSGVTDDTTAIFLESAYFNPIAVRKTAKRHGLNTDASFRFERGIDVNLVAYCLKRAALLIIEIAGGEASKIVDLYPKEIEGFNVTLDLNRLNSIAGIEIEANAVEDILSWLDIKIISKNDHTLAITVPAYRVDVTREIDVIEEVMRIYGFNNIPIPDHVNSSLSYGVKPDKEKLQNIVSDLLTSNGFAEAMSNSLTKESYASLANAKHINPDWNVKMLNPLSIDLGVLRQSLIFSGLESISYNINRRSSDLKLYEFGNVYFKRNDGFEETSYLSIFLTGQSESERWNSPNQQVSFYAAKGAVESVLSRLGILKNLQTKSTSNELMQDGIELTIAKKKVADIGWVKSELLKSFGINQPVYYAEINWNVVLELMKMNKTKFKPMTKYPAVRRDLSLLIDSSVQFAQIEEIARKSEKQLLKEIDLFDVYEGKNLAEGKKSYAVKFILQDSEATLQDSKIDGIMKTIQKQLEQRLGAELR
jgi:phenylalanyl-tRNA synthetase beta chain